jgi:acyl carrier protein
MGITEASSTIFAQPLPPADRKLGSVGVPFGFEVKVIDGAGNVLGDGESGEIVVRGPSVMRGYYRDAAATAEVLDSTGWLRTGDLGYRDGDGHFFLIGRIKDLMVKGGVNIAPQEIERAIIAHPGVADVAVVGTADPYLGQEIVAFVVPMTGAACEARQLLDHCEREVGPFKTPSRIRWIAELPRGLSGKVQRHRLLDLVEPVDFVGERSADSRGQAPQPADGGDEGLTIAQIFASVLGVERVEAHDDFFVLGGDSLLATQLVSGVRRSLGIELSLREVFEHPTAAGLAGHIEASGRGTLGGPMAPARPLSPGPV